MKQKYPDGKEVIAPGTVIISAAAHCNDIQNVIEPVLQPVEGSKLFWIDFSSDDLRLWFCICSNQQSNR